MLQGQKGWNRRLTSSKSKTPAPVSRVNAWVRTETLHKLQEKAQAEGTTVSELLRYAIGLSEYLEFMRAKGALVFVVRPDGSTTEILSRIPGEPTTETPPTYLIPGREEVRNQIELVKSVQNALKELAKRDNDPRLDPGEPDGDYGLKTKQAISVLQAKEHLPVTGVVDSRTLVELVHS